MATISSNGTGGGLWSSTLTWSGGAVPSNSDSVIIEAGDVITMDADLSGFANGLRDMFITGSTTSTPGMLRFMDGTNGYIKAYALNSIFYGILGNVVTANSTTNMITFVSPSTTPYPDGTPVMMMSTLTTPTASPSNISNSCKDTIMVYYLRNISGSTAKLASSYDGAAIDLTGNGTGILRCAAFFWGPTIQNATNVNTTTGVLTWNGTAPANSTVVKLFSTYKLPTGFSESTLYYVRGSSDRTCQLATTDSDSTIVIPSAVNTGYLSMFIHNCKGRLLANSDGVWGNSTPLSSSYTAKLLLNAENRFKSNFLDIALYASHPTNWYVETYGTPYVVTGSAANNTITFASPSTTPPQDGTPVEFRGSDLPSPLVAGITYYIRDVSADTAKVASTYGGDAIDLSTDGSGTINCNYGKWGPITQNDTNINISTGAITWNGVLPVEGTMVKLKTSGTIPTGWSVDCLYYVRSVSGVTCKLAPYNSDVCIIIPSDFGSGNLTMYVGAASGTKTLLCVQDVTGDSLWTTTSDMNLVTICNTVGLDGQNDSLASIESWGLTITDANVDSNQAPLSRLYLCSRNVSLRRSGRAQGTGYNWYGGMIDYWGSTSGTNVGIGGNGSVLSCEFRGDPTITGDDTPYGSTATSGGLSLIFSGIISRCTIGGLYYICGNWNVSGAIVGMSVGAGLDGSSTAGSNYLTTNISGRYNVISAFFGGLLGALYTKGTASVSSMVHGGSGYWNNSVVYLTSSSTFSGTIVGSITGSGCGGDSSITMSGNIYNCQTGLYNRSSLTNTIYGIVMGCNIGINGGCIYSNCIVKCNNIGTVIADAYNIRNATFSQNVTTDIQISATKITALTGSNINLQSSTKVIGYKYVDHYLYNYFYPILQLYYVNNEEGVYIYTPGGRIEANGPTQYVLTAEDSNGDVWCNFPFRATANKKITVTVTGQLSGTSNWTDLPIYALADLSKPWRGSGEILASATQDNDTNEHTYVFTYIPVGIGYFDINFLVRAKGGDVLGTGTETDIFSFDIAFESIIANVRSFGGYS